VQYDLQLQKGGRLVASEWDSNKNDFTTKEVRVEEFRFHLNDTICLGHGVTLRDIFALISNDLHLFCMNTGCMFLVDLANEALSAPIMCRYDIVALRLGWGAILDVDGGNNFFEYHIDFHGLKQGNKRCGVQFFPANELAAYPIILDERFDILDGQSDKVILETNRKFHLLDVVCGVVDELSYMGSPEIKKFALQEIRDTQWQFTSNSKKIVSMYEEIGRPCTACGEEARYPSFGKPHDICINCFNKMKEN